MNGQGHAAVGASIDAEAIRLHCAIVFGYLEGLVPIRLLACAHHGDPATDSMNIRPPIPQRSGHRLHEHPATLV